MFCLLSACAPSTRTFVGTGLDTLYDDRAQLERLAGSPELQEAARSLAAAAVQGGVDAATDESHSKRIEAQTERLIKALGPLLVQIIEEDIGPATRAELQLAIRDAVLHATSGPVQGRVERMATGVSTAIAEVLLPRVGPAVGETLRSEVLPAIEEQLRQAVMQQHDNLIRTATQQAMLGIADALDGPLGSAIDARTSHAATELGERIEDQSGIWKVLVGMLTTGLLALGGLTALAMWNRTQRATRIESSLRMVMKALKDSEDLPGVRAAVNTIKARGKDRDTGMVLKTILRDHPDLRIEIKTDPDGAA